MRNLSLLIINDNPDDILIIKNYLLENEYSTYDFVEAGTLESALELIPHYYFDAILLDLDIRCSGYSCFDLTGNIAVNLPDTAVIVLSRAKNEELALKAVHYGTQDYLEKQHLSPVSLSKSLRYAIERKKASQDKEDLLSNLNLALQKLALLENFLPLCIGCKRVLGSDEQWHILEDYSGRPYTADGARGVSTGSGLICPDCLGDLEKEEQALPVETPRAATAEGIFYNLFTNRN
jgi:CheY-like chemotaxis protein